MSVAFRRESDEEHKEPKFEVPIPAGPNRVTPRGMAAIEARVIELEDAVRSLTGDALETAKRDLRYWHTRRTTAEVTVPPPDGSAGFGTSVTYRLNGATRTIAIVGDDEANPAAGRIAWTAPLATALAGAEPGERVDFNGRAEALEIVAVAPIGD